MSIPSFRSILLVAATVALAACSDNPTTTPDTKVTPKDAAPDGQAGDLGPLGDGLVFDTVMSPDTLRPDSIGSPSALQVVVNSLTLPTSGTQYAVDLDGNGTKDNQLGLVVGALKLVIPTGMDLQAGIDSQLAYGAFLLLYDVLAKSITNDTGMKVQFFLGADLDGFAYNNFSGSEEFGLSPSNPTTPLTLSGTITSNALQVTGELAIPIPIGTSTTTVNLKKAQLKATLSSTGMKSGQINGAIPQTEMDNKLLPAMATMLDNTWKTTTDATLKGILTSFDTDKNGTISGTDLKNNGLIGLFIKADVDTDGDKKVDAMSVGLAFTAVTCKIKNTIVYSDAGPPSDGGVSKEASVGADAGASTH